MSHPTWVRGLKHKEAFQHIETAAVAPHVGAWIETFARTLPINQAAVAPHVGAWIETRCRAWLCSTRGRRTPRGCVD